MHKEDPVSMAHFNKNFKGAHNLYNIRYTNIYNTLVKAEVIQEKLPVSCTDFLNKGDDLSKSNSGCIPSNGIIKSIYADSISKSLSVLFLL